MSVIGRLDKQVDAVLIEPVRRNKRRENEDEDVPATQRAPEISAPPMIETTEKRREHDEATQDELPVWLL